ncbi:glycosyl transferase family protein [Motiliproteus sp. SC1-56]|uniref:glycosyl transferase family protein n=1 Tax=Motiliproteus sp. SC1-56 TaxID=2799565 RepID=UPI001A8F5D57|nr:glycosyl transferase family protein [Motiliproteus sp. SC1-56]
MSDQEHPFAPFVRILGKGKKGTRSLSVDEARDAMSMILAGEVRPEQLGAFLMLLRVKEESPQELAGFAEAVRARMSAPTALSVGLDWSTYAGKKNRLPWFLLSALVLAGEGVRILMHGARGHTPGRLYIEDLLPRLGLRAAASWLDVELDLARQNFSFVPITMLSPVLAEIINLRPILGLRSPVHTLCRLLNPLDAPYRVDGVFHPAYGPLHQQTAALLGHANSVTIRGDGGEAEIKPDGESSLQWLRQGEYCDQVWPRRFERRLIKEEALDPQDLLRLWRGEIQHEYGEAAAVETLAICLRLLAKADTDAKAREQADALWAGRDRQAF